MLYRLIRFTDTGDFEDVTLNNALAFILQIDGTIFISNTQSLSKIPKMKCIPIQSLNNEGLIFDAAQNLLFWAGKNNPEEGNSHQQISLDMPYSSLTCACFTFALCSLLTLPECADRNPRHPPDPQFHFLCTFFISRLSAPCSLLFALCPLPSALGSFPYTLNGSSPYLRLTKLNVNSIKHGQSMMLKGL